MNSKRIILNLILLLGAIPCCTFAQGKPSSAWEERQNTPPLSFQQFKKGLEKALNNLKLDPEHQTFHFVILFDTVHPNGIRDAMMRDVVYGLLRYYLVEGSNTADMVSLVPYQMEVRLNRCVWNQPFSLNEAEKLYRSLPTDSAPGYVGGGHNIEGALITAAAHVVEPHSCIFITLSSSEVSQLQKGQTLPDQSDALKQTGLIEQYADRAVSFSQDNLHEQPRYLYYRIYTQGAIQPLGTLSGRTRSEILSASLPAQPRSASSSPAAAAPASTAPDSHSHFPFLSLLLVLAALILAGGIFFFLSLSRPRTVELKSGGVSKPIELRYGTYVYLGNREDNDKKLLLIPGLEEAIMKDNTSKNEKMAMLEVTRTGQVQLTKKNWTFIPSFAASIVITNEDKKIILSSEEGSASSRQISLSIHRMK